MKMFFKKFLPGILKSPRDAAVERFSEGLYHLMSAPYLVYNAHHEPLWVPVWFPGRDPAILTSGIERAMIEIKSGTLEERIIKILQNSYPVTLEQLKKKTGLPRSILEMELIKMQAKQICLLEPLPDKVYIRLVRTDFRFVGRRTQQKFIKRKKGEVKKEEYQGDADEVMYG